MEPQRVNCLEVIQTIAAVVSALVAIFVAIGPSLQRKETRDKFNRSIWRITYWLSLLVLVAAVLLKLLVGNGAIQGIGPGWIPGLAAGGILMGFLSLILISRQQYRDDEAEFLPSPRVHPSYDAEDLLRPDPIPPHHGPETPPWLRQGDPLPPPRDPPDTE